MKKKYSDEWANDGEQNKSRSKISKTDNLTFLSVLSCLIRGGF